MKVVLSDKASEDLLRLYSFLTKENPQTAKATLFDIDTKLQHLTRFPFLGRQRDALLTGLRGLVVGDRVIFYITNPDSITVIRVIDSRMDVDAEFQK